MDVVGRGMKVVGRPESGVARLERQFTKEREMNAYRESLKSTKLNLGRKEKNGIPCRVQTRANSQ